MAHTKRKDTAAGTATDVEQIMVLTELRFALGDNGKRMFPELIEYAKEIYADAMKYRNGANVWLRGRLRRSRVSEANDLSQLLDCPAERRK